MRKLLFTICSLFSVYNLSAQWVGVGGGTNGAIEILSVYQGNLYAGGVFTKSGGINTNLISKWNGTKWDSLSNGVKAGYYKGIESILGYDSILYASGQFDTVYDTCHYRSILQWNGTKFDSLDGGLTDVTGANVTCLAVYNNELYAGGSFQSHTSKITGLAKWNGVRWDSVLKGITDMPWTMLTYNGKLYVAGVFDTMSGVPANNIASWDGSKWDSLGSGIQYVGAVYCMAVCNGKLYAGGDFIEAGGKQVNNIAVWDGTKWDSLAGGANNTVYGMTVFNNKLYVGGMFDTIGHQAISEVAEWDGSQWLPVGAGFSGGSYGVFSLAIYDSTLYAAGGFAKSGSTPLSNIAMWTGPLGIDEVTNKDNAVKVYPNPSNGIFTFEDRDIGSKKQVEVFNMLGEQVYKACLSTSFATVNLTGQPAGIYLYRITTMKGELLGDGKLTIE